VLKTAPQISLNSTDTNGSTPLVWALTFGEIKAANLLVSRGANLFLKDKVGMRGVDFMVHGLEVDCSGPMVLQYALDLRWKSVRDLFCVRKRIIDMSHRSSSSSLGGVIMVDGDGTSMTTIVTTKKTKKRKIKNTKEGRKEGRKPKHASVPSPDIVLIFSNDTLFKHITDFLSTSSGQQEDVVPVVSPSHPPPAAAVVAAVADAVVTATNKRTVLSPSPPPPAVVVADFPPPTNKRKRQLSASSIEAELLIGLSG
jgi:hypothetical protein